MSASIPSGGLTCGQVLARLSDYVDGELSASDHAAVAAHVRDCPDCARFGGAFAAVLDGLRRRLRGTSTEAMDPAVAARLDEALRRGR